MDFTNTNILPSVSFIETFFLVHRISDLSDIRNQLTNGIGVCSANRKRERERERERERGGGGFCFMRILFYKPTSWSLITATSAAVEITITN